jgi:malate dehydrogenase (oxaloacetate-decarboxylating)
MRSTTADSSAAHRGRALLENPLLNKGTAFTEDERRDLGLAGLLPPRVETLEEQVVRAYSAFSDYASDQGKHINLRALQDTNEVLFYRLLLDHLEEMVPILYTPTVGLACQQFSHIYRRSRGLFASYPLRDRLPELIRNRPNQDVDVIVVTDGERILGLGDQGAGGLGIPIGKLSLYTSIGGIDPARTLPIVLDVGTNNPGLLDDPTYIGWRHERITGDDYFNFVEQFVRAIEEELPAVLLQWEDFAAAHARALLDRYRDRLLTFNDDIQGTAAVTLGALIGAVHASGSRLSEQTVVILGAGSAGVGVADMIRAAMVADGLPVEEARQRFFLINTKGLLTESRTDLNAEQRNYAQPAALTGSWQLRGAERIGLAEVVANVRATILIGLSTDFGAFTEPIVRELAAKVERPIIFPLSNPTARSEADPADLMRWTDGRALVAAGSPYPPLDLGARSVPVAQSNNIFVFPGIGLGAVAVKATRVTDGMIEAAATALGRMSPALVDASEPLLPPVGELLGIAREVAHAVAVKAIEEGVAPALSPDEARVRIAATQWMPSYHIRDGRPV